MHDHLMSILMFVGPIVVVVLGFLYFLNKKIDKTLKLIHEHTKQSEANALKQVAKLINE